MSEYTQSFITAAESLDSDDERMLYENAKAFRGFDKAFIAFISEHGYEGDLADIKVMTKFVRTKFAKAGVPALHNFRDLFNPARGNSDEPVFTRETAFKICFALGLNVEKTNDFFKRVMFERGIDCHTISEAVYYFSLNNGLSYLEARSIMEEIPKVKSAKKLPGEDVLYTDKIKDSIDRISDREKLIRYIMENLDSFEYNNATAIKFIRFLWKEVIGTEDDTKMGLAFQEGKLIDEMQNPLHPNQKKRPVGDTRSKESVKTDIERESELKKDDYVISEKNASTWTIYCQIMGLDHRQEMIHASTRSLSPVFKDNVLMPLKASYCFPSQQTLDGILRGESDGEHEKFRKMLIFLAFYTYCVKKLILHKDVFFSFDYHDGERCQQHVNRYLLDAGYPELYYGNPYDWIFLWSMRDEHPLDIFRRYMREVYIAKSEMPGSQSRDNKTERR